MAFKGLQLADTAFLGRAGNAINPASFPGLLRWYKADEYTPYASDNDTVGGGGATWGPWTDYAGSGDNATGLGVFRTNQIGTQPLLFMTGTAFTFAPGALADFTAVYVGMTVGLNDSYAFYNTGTGHQIRSQFSGVHEIVFYAGVGVVTSSALAAGGVLEVLVVRRSAGVITFYQNKVARGGGADANAWTVNTLGNASGSPGTEKFAEILLYNTVLSTTDLDSLYDGYLKPKWTLP